MSDPRIEVLERHLNQRRAELAAALGAVPERSRGLVSRAGVWSVAMVLEHLVETERGVTRLLGRLYSAASRRAADTFDLDAFERHIDMPVFLDRSRRIRLSQPSGALGAEEAWRALVETRAQLLEALRRGEGLLLEDVSFAHPAGGALDGYRWVAFVGLHEARHAAQIREIQEQLEDHEGRPGGTTVAEAPNR